MAGKNVLAYTYTPWPKMFLCAGCPGLIFGRRLIHKMSVAARELNLTPHPTPSPEILPCYFGCKKGASEWSNFGQGPFVWFNETFLSEAIIMMSSFPNDTFSFVCL